MNNAFAQRNQRNPQRGNNSFQMVCSTKEFNNLWIDEKDLFVYVDSGGRRDLTLSQIFRENYKIVSYATNYSDTHNTVKMVHILVVEQLKKQMF